ncbi:MAG: hypothetical protein JSS61_07225 [Verrucomicrobia bacterium]|nr:hypothetical protein [Verrucomicrobiota bacterium]
MRTKFYAIVGLLGLVLAGCQNNDNNQSVVSQRYIHKYGYAVSKDEWDMNTYPGQVITSLDTGVTITATYENGTLHGPTTYTYPHSQTVEHYFLYNNGSKVKEISYDPAGMPLREWIQLSPARHSLTMWYKEGSPMQIEEYAGNELIDGQYFSTENELEARVEKGAGLRIRRSADGTLLAKEVFEEGYAIKKETFYPNGSPESIAYYYHDKLNGEKRTFAQNGEPLSIEEWVAGQLHGKATYFKNGNRYLEISYLYGQKNGLETHFIDGDIISQEIAWENDLKHGTSIFYADGKSDTHWFYAGELVSKRKFDELNHLDEIIANIPNEMPARR